MSNSTTSTPEDVTQNTEDLHPDFDQDLHPGFDYTSYENSFANRAKQVYICLQALMMTVYMVIGISSYQKINPGWSKVKSLFVFQGIVVAMLVYNEFTGRAILGIFLILVLGHYTLFLAFCLVMDSCTTNADEDQTFSRPALLFNRTFRLAIHVLTCGLLAYGFFERHCDESIYPKHFMALIIVIMVHQVYDIYLARHNYLIDFDNLPPTSPNKLRFNKELFTKQTGCLLYINIIFGVLCALAVLAGSFILNRQGTEGHQVHILCHNSTEWIYMTPVGNVFGTLHQILILMQINLVQVVMVRIPKGMGIFEKKITDHASIFLRERLLGQMDTTTGESQQAAGESTNADDNFKQQRSTSNSLLRLKSQLMESKEVKKDTFKI